MICDSGNGESGEVGDSPIVMTTSDIVDRVLDFVVRGFIFGDAVDRVLDFVVRGFVFGDVVSGMVGEVSLTKKSEDIDGNFRLVVCDFVFDDGTIDLASGTRLAMITSMGADNFRLGASVRRLPKMLSTRSINDK